MNATHLHLILNHFPVIGTLVGIGVIFHGYITRSEEIKKTALWIWTAMAVIAIPVYLTGESAEEAVEHLAGVSESLIHEHEEMAELAIWLMEALGAFSFLSLVIYRVFPSASRGKVIFVVATCLSLAVFGVMARTGYLGGQISHAELRNNQAQISVGEHGVEHGEWDDDD